MLTPTDGVLHVNDCLFERSCGKIGDHPAGGNPRTMIKVVLGLTAAVLSSGSAAIAADTSLSGFDAYKTHLAQRARAAGIRDATVRAHLPFLRFNVRAVELDRAQRPASFSMGTRVPPLGPYLRQHVTPTLIWRGQSRHHSLWPNLYRIQTSYGVDSAVLLAIYGKETSYGAVTGNFDLLEVLASLAYEGRRRAMFEAEVLAALTLLDAGVSRSRLRGSYAGATGYPQFMPSVVLRLRADGDGDGFADIWSNEADALASIANYLRDAGWKPGLRWGAEVVVPPTLDRTAVRSTEASRHCPAVLRRHSRWLSVAEWRALGVTPVKDSLPDTALATLLEPDGPNERPYLLTSNYHAVLRYNCSNFYAMSVAVLSDAIARR